MIRRIFAATAIATLAGLTLLVLLTLDAYFANHPIHPVNSPFRWMLFLPAVIEATALLSRRFARNRSRIRKISSEIIYRSRKTKRWLAANVSLVHLALSAVPIVFAIFWIPEYLTQPLWTDHEHMVVMARLWDLGEFPWHAMRTYQFPGGMETAWFSGKVFGWGRPVGYFATSIGLLLVLCVVQVEWSRRNLGSRVFGFSGAFALMMVEASLPFTNVAQRDSHTIWLIMIAFLAPTAFGSRTFGICLSAIAYSLSLAFRPHAVIFIPLMICGIYWKEIIEANIDRPTILSVPARLIRNRWTLAWAFACVIATLIFMSPVLGPNRTPEFLEAMKFPLTEPSDYSQGAFNAWKRIVKHSLTTDRHLIFLMLSIAMMVVPNPPKWKRMGLLLFVFWFCGGFYRAIHPVDHGYLKLPLQFLECLGGSVFPAWVLSKYRSIPAFAMISIFGFLATFAPPTNSPFVSIREWPANLLDLAGIEPLIDSPVGARHSYPDQSRRYHYDWSDFKGAERWLRKNSDTSTRVLNLLSFQPYPAFLGTVDRLPIGRLESCVLMLWFKKFDFDTEIEASLRAAPAGSIVIWDNERTNTDIRYRLTKSADYIRSNFVETVRFGEIEVWVKPQKPEQSVSESSKSAFQPHTIPTMLAPVPSDRFESAIRSVSKAPAGSLSETPL
jgi:hypothetical protein